MSTTSVTAEFTTTSDGIRRVARRMAEGASIDTIAAELKVPRLFVENTVKFIKELTEISSSESAEPIKKDKLDFIETVSVLRKCVTDNFAGACITSEYGNNNHNETEIDFVYNGENYTISLHQERVLFVKEVSE